MNIFTAHTNWSSTSPAGPRTATLRRNPSTTFPPGILFGDVCMGSFVRHPGRASGPLSCIQWSGQDLFWMEAQYAMWPTNSDFLSTAEPKRTGEALPAPRCWESLILRSELLMVGKELSAFLPPFRRIIRHGSARCRLHRLATLHGRS